MEQSHFIRSLRITFLTVGFLAFVFMTAHWIQHVSTAKPVLAPQIIAVQHDNGLTNQKLSLDMQQPSIVSFVRSSSVVTPAKSPKTHQLTAKAVAATAALSQDTSHSSSRSLELLDLPIVTDLNSGGNNAFSPASSSNRAHLPHNTAP